MTTDLSGSELVSSRHTTERLGRLETSVEILRADSAETRKLLLTIQDAVSRGRETNWPLVIACVMATGALYAAAIRPLEQDTMRAHRVSEKLEEAVIVQNADINALKVQVTKLGTELGSAATVLNELRLNGSAVADKRMSLMEFRIEQLRSGKQ